MLSTPFPRACCLLKMVCIKLMINDRHIKEFQVHYDLWLIVVGCRFESNCPLVGPGIIGGMRSVGVSF